MAAVTSVGETPLAAPARRPRGMQAGRRRRLNAFRYVVFTVFGLFFLLPLLALLRFSLEGSTLGTWSIAAWKQIVSYQGPPPLLSAPSRSPWSWACSPAWSRWRCWSRP